MINKIILVIPNYRWKSRDSKNTLWHFVPYNLCLLAAVLEQKKKYEIKIIDAYYQDMSVEEFETAVTEEQPDFVGISVLMDFYGVSGHIAAEVVKKVNPNIITEIGGVYATANPERIIKDENIDYLVCGEGEVALPELVEFLGGGGIRTAQRSMV